ncbi:alpha/beta hydrolase [Alkalilimnicola ehrlichii]|uniref:Alpha/beta hydrolase n=1 Tax=Alkalilimnicola ehrlichii TaxID=351052 RepID=A0A3E0WTV5_9GAMM|nr:alpha/beta fold hydrolase [Alkalilimnicola ehrlichii]RFA27230.1 alpha/beta hydrolase [Alkalilimnicola ehrlichii]RFA35406.1 alpha/beta hydrolase [Alkalilimnicola ehrlichii]
MSTHSPVALHYTEQGKGQPLLILHGLYGSGANWGRYAKSLAGDYRVIVPDLRNHGRSPHDPDMSYPAMAADLRALLDREGIDQAIVLGHSMGGKAAMTLALENPARVTALIAADIAPVPYTGHEHRDLIAALQDVPLDAVDSRADADAHLREAIPTEMVRQFLLTNLQRQNGGYQWRIPLQILSDQRRLIEGFPDFDAVYQGPSLFVHGENSDYVTDEALTPIRERFPQASVEAIPNAGHWLHVEQPEAFSSCLNGFLKKTAG